MENIAELLRAVLQEEIKPLKKDIQTIKEGQKRLERKSEDISLLACRSEITQPLEVLSILERLERKLDNIKVDNDYFSGKLGKQDREIHRLNKLLDSHWD